MKNDNSPTDDSGSSDPKISFNKEELCAVLRDYVNNLKAVDEVMGEENKRKR